MNKSNEVRNDLLSIGAFGVGLVFFVVILAFS